ncbi:MULTISPECIES: adenosylmethionine decarboxylase [Acidiplasma]|uniref:S-adenosylmethionine decarboxylase proenzyme n=1 Tax=Acidiplasma cupricumulans TaxID=312540 RepID=A0A0Q0VIU9_9ARCH|nr:MULTISPECIES: adenosylmethionine decarboxylase [Acidiplasma]KJE49819.1 S-adenosylmethionine decarboxylase proenzyme [Acidiplasma sp. MBA-1]KQB33458.1 S-adenosylmethionine decarboxylase proenzyme [Acidiplasma cupricumulans]WMT54978.1 MAG: adenosylmethionine decarboxylase [Acidiplasma sp.]
MKVVVGVHIIADLYGVDAGLISSADSISPLMENAIKEGNLTKISSQYYQFRPMGASGIALLAESHLSFHTWPEYGLVTLDIYTCGDRSNADKAFNYLLNVLKPTSIEYKKLERGNKVDDNVTITDPSLML